MSKFRHTLRRWREPFLGERGHQPTIDLGPIAGRVYGGCMGLPQEVIERIMDMLQDNRRALKACSLTCKAMFASSRRLIHQTLHLTWETNQKILTPAEKKRYAEENPRELRLRLLSFMGERDLLKYARHLNIHMEMRFSLRAPEPHLQHFRSFDRIHTLTIHRYYAYPWREGENPLFMHFYPALTTLVLNRPTSRSHNVLRFALQFPNLQNLTLESLWEETWPSSVPPVVGQSPPLRGHFRCAGLSSTHPVWPRKFAFDLPHGINFRSVEFQNVCWEQGQQILDGCASSLEEFAIHIAEDGVHELDQLKFQENTSLRSIVLRTPFPNLSRLALLSLCASLSTNTSLAFSEFVLELGRSPSGFTQPSTSLWGCWDEIDKLFEGFLNLRPDFKLVIRTGRLYNRDEFQAQAKERFPLMASRDRIQFETSLVVDKHWN